MKPLFIDIETAALPEAECQPFAPDFAAPKNIKDPVKIAEAIAAKKLAWQEDAALDARRARVLVVGVLGESLMFLHGEDEAETLLRAFEQVQATLFHGERVVGHNLLAFDMPFLVRRAWHLKVPVPSNLREGRYWNNLLTDTMDLWRMGMPLEQGRISLDHLAKHLGVGAKTGNGKDFAKLWETNRDEALAYLENDLRLTALCYERMTA